MERPPGSPHLTAPSAWSVVAPDGEAPTWSRPWSGAERWEIRGELGAGAMGLVLLARDHWLGRDVAIKEPRSEADTARLRHEAAITARLEHPGVLPVYDVGLSPTGQPWFAMRLVRGTSLSDAIREASDPRARLRLLRPLLTVCETVAFAHERGVVHRDLKPANVMLGGFGEALVIDWGLAVEADGATRSSAGTARYMSPQQARGEPARPSDDVYGLGLILFETVAGGAAFQHAGASGIDADRVAHVLSTQAIAPELRAIVLRAIAPDPVARYPHAKALASDLAHYLDGMRVSAHQYTTRELLRRLVRAHKAPLAVGAVALVVLVVLLVVGIQRIRGERDLANESLASALAAASERALFLDARAEAEVLAAHSFALRPLPESRGVLAQLPPRRPTITHLSELGGEPLAIFERRILQRVDGGVALVEGGVERWRMPLEPSMQVGFLERGTRWVAFDRQQLVVYDSASAARVRGPAYTPTFSIVNPGADGRSLVMFNPQWVTRVRADRDEVVRAEACRAEGFSAFGLDGDGERWIASCFDGAIVRGSFAVPGSWSVVSSPSEHDAHITALAFLPGEAALILGTTQGAIAVRDLETGQSTLVASGEGLVHGITVDAVGRRAVVRRDLGAPLVVDVAARASLGRLPREAVARLVVFSGDGSLIVAGQRLERWDFAGVQPRALRFPDGIAALAGSPDGRMLAVAHGPTLSVFDLATRTLFGRRRWPQWMVKDLAFAPDGRSIVAYGFGDAAVISLALTPELPEIGRTPAPKSVRRVAVLAGGAIVRATHRHGVWQSDASGDRQVLETSARDLAVSPDGLHLAALTEEFTIFHDTTALTACGNWPGASAVAVDLVGTIVVARGDTVRIACAGRDGAEDLALAYRAPDAELTTVEVSSRWLVAGARDGAIWVWARGEPGVHLVARPHEARVSELVLGEDGVASGSWDGRVAFVALPGPSAVSPAAIEAAWGTSLGELSASAAAAPMLMRGDDGLSRPGSSATDR